MREPSITCGAPVVKAGDGLRAWNNIIDDTFAGCVVDSAESRFKGELWGCRLNAINLVRARARSCRVERWLNTAPRNASGSVLLHLQSEGYSINHQRGRVAQIGPGEGMLCDPDHSYTIDFPNSHEMFVVELPLAGVVAREPGFDLERFSGHKVEKRRTQLLLSFLQTAWLQRECLGNDPDWRDCVSRTSADLAMRSISQVGGHEVVGASAELRRAVIEYIRRNLADTELRTSTIAGALDISARSVQSVFERLATTTSGFILMQRLERAAEQLLLEPGRLSITELAYDCGFSDSAYFSRCFKRYYGVAPRHYRRDGHVT